MPRGAVISSAVEGDTFVTAYAPEIHNNDNQRVFVTQRWVDAEWTIPQPAVNRAGSEHIFTTSITRHTDKQPLANYRVRYTILDGPPAVFLPDRTQVTTVISDLSGNAKASMVQVTPQAGQNKIGIEIIRPPDPTSPGGVGVDMGSLTGPAGRFDDHPDHELSRLDHRVVAVLQQSDLPHRAAGETGPDLLAYLVFHTVK